MSFFDFVLLALIVFGLCGVLWSFDQRLRSLEERFKDTQPDSGNEMD